MLLRIILLSILGYLILNVVKNWISGALSQPRVKEQKSPGDKEENIQKKYANKIEDADFEELE